MNGASESNQPDEPGQSIQPIEPSQPTEPSQRSQTLQPDYFPTFTPANAPIEHEPAAQPDPFPTFIPFNVPPIEKGPTGLCFSCHHIRPLVFVKPPALFEPNPPPFFEPAPPPFTMGGKKNRPTPPQRQEVVLRWKNYFGAGDLKDWQRLCQDLGLDGDLPSKKKCREALRSINVNIWDFLDAVEVGGMPQMFLTKKELVRYTWNTGRIFPKGEAKNMGPVAALLKLLR